MTLEEAVACLERELLRRGEDGVLRDVVCHLVAESGNEALLASNWHDDGEPPWAFFALPRHYGDDESFDEALWVERAIAINRAGIVDRGCRWLH
jgi:hypothetical protein